jgi:thioredoxin 1
MGATKQITDASFEAEVLAAPGPVLVDFWAEWCSPCKMIAPALEEIGASMAGKLTVAKINIDDNPKTPSRFGVKAIPTLILFNNGQVVAQKLGAVPKGKLAEWIQSSLPA